MKKLIAGLIIGAITASSFNAFASNNVIATFSNFNFVVNGEHKTVETKPLVVDGTSYLPVREISNLLGFQVDYNPNSRTIELNSNITGSEFKTGDSQETTEQNIVETEFKGLEAIDVNGTLYWRMTDLTTKKPEFRHSITWSPQERIIEITLGNINHQISTADNNGDALIYEEKVYLHSKYYIFD